jgi:hypothetical protein
LALGVPGHGAGEANGAKAAGVRVMNIASPRVFAAVLDDPYDPPPTEHTLREMVRSHVCTASAGDNDQSHKVARFGRIDLCSQAEILSALRTDTPPSRVPPGPIAARSDSTLPRRVPT